MNILENIKDRANELIRQKYPGLEDEIKMHHVKYVLKAFLKIITEEK